MSQNKPKVWILSGDSRLAATLMFQNHGFQTCGSTDNPDLICFLGGTDVDPGVYGAERHPMTQSPDHQRDEFEVAVFKKFPDTPKVGICRGGQLLNVLNGGRMVQDHGLKSGNITLSGYVEKGSYLAEEKGVVVADHHQGFIARNGCEIAWSDNYTDNSMNWTSYAAFYPDTKSLCIQWHPEWAKGFNEDYFFELLHQCLGFENAAS